MTLIETGKNHIPLFRSRLLAAFPGIIHGMSTRQGRSDGSPFGFNLGFDVGDDPPRVERHYQKFLAALELQPEQIASMRQVHGDNIMSVDEPGIYPDTDALVTRTRDLALCVRVADCVPIICFVPAHNVIAGIHAGWKGTSLGIARKTIAFLMNTYRIGPEDVFCYFGPSARSCCYEVDPATAALFEPATVVTTEGKKPRLDLQLANQLDLSRCGIPEQNIEIERVCTICHPALTHSHRRDQHRAGRMLAVISIRSTPEDE